MLLWANGVQCGLRLLEPNSMGYIEKTLTKGETVEYTAKLNPWHFLPWFLYSILLIWWGKSLMEGELDGIFSGLIFIFCAIAILIWVVLQLTTTEIAVTNKRVIHKVGLISRKTTEIAFTKIESIEVNQGIFGRMLNYGNIQVRGTGANISKIKGIDEPLKFRAAVMHAGDL